MSGHEWDRWLHEWNRQLLHDFDPDQPDAFVDPDVTPAAIASGWLGFPGAGEAELGALEARLGTRLPPSYRSFLRSSNGFLQPGVIVPRLLAAHEVDWFRVGHQDTIAAWNDGVAGGPETFERHLPHALQVSAIERVGTAVYLLNPDVVDAEGEWEAFYFAHWVPGVNRYPSFLALMLAERDRHGAPPLPPPPSRRETWWNALRWIFRPT